MKFALWVLIIGVMLSALVAHQYALHNQTLVEAQAEFEAQEAFTQVVANMRQFEFGLSGIEGAIAQVGLSALQRDHIADYVNASHIDKMVSGALGFGFIRRVPAADVPAFVELAAQDKWPNFRVKELNPNAGERFIIQYIEPAETNLQAVGLDIASETNRYDAAAKAADLGTIQITGPITLVQASGDKLQSFLILKPIRLSAVRATHNNTRNVNEGDNVDSERVIGWSYAPLIMQRVLKDIAINNQQVRLVLSDVTNEQAEEVFFRSDNLMTEPVLTVSRQRQVYGRDWSMVFQVKPQFVAAMNLVSPWLLFSIGLLLTTAGSLIVFSGSRSKQQKKQLENQQARMATMVENSADAIISLDTNSCITSWNKGAEDILGYRSKHILGDNVTSLMPKPRLPDWQNIVQTLAENAIVRQYETCWIARSHDVLNVEITASPLTDDHGVHVGAMLTVRDVTHKKQLEASFAQLHEDLKVQVEQRTHELAELNILLTNILQSAFTFSVIATDERGMIKVFNSGAEKLLGYRAADVENQKHLASLHLSTELLANSESITGTYADDALFARAREQGHEIREWHYVDAQRGVIPVRVTTSPMYGKDRALVGYLAIAQDITDEKANRAALARATEKLTFATNVANLGVWSWHVEQDYLEWNDNMFTIYEHTPTAEGEPIPFSYWEDRVHPDDIIDAKQQLQDAVEYNIPFDTTFRIVLPDNTVRHIAAKALSTLDANGKVISLTGFNRDITQEYELASNLRKAKQKADEASEAKSTFLANISHEIRTPMNAIVGLNYLLKQVATNDVQLDYLAKTEVAAKLLLALIGDLLDYAKIEANKLQLSPTTFCFETLWQDLATVLSGISKRDNVELLFDVDANLPWLVTTDALRLQQIMVNLASNALKFTHHGAVTITAKLTAQTDHYSRVTFEVSDSGIGMTPEELNSLFQPFHQADASISRRYGGTGLGLVITHRLVALMGSELNVSSEKGKGSRFWFEVNFAQVNGQQPSLKEQLAGGGLSVCCIDMSKRHEFILHKISKVLQWQIHRLTLKATDASDVLDQCIRKQQVALLDGSSFNFAQNSGVDWLELVNQRASTQPIIVFTQGGNMLQAWQQTLHKDVIVLEHPITPYQLCRAVSSMITPQPTLLQMEHEKDDAPSVVLDGMRVLLVENVEINRLVVIEVLQQRGVIVTEAENGRQAVNIIEQSPEHNFDLVLMDMQMPEMDGLQATRLIREQLQRYELPIIAMTANVADSDIQACRAAGMNAHVGKPFNVDELLHVLEDVFHGTGHSQIR